MTNAEREEKFEYLRKFIKPELGVYTIDMFETITFLLSEIDRRDEALREIGHAEGRGQEPSIFMFRKIAREALGDEE